MIVHLYNNNHKKQTAKVACVCSLLVTWCMSLRVVYTYEDLLFHNTIKMHLPAYSAFLQGEPVFLYQILLQNPAVQSHDKYNH